MAETKTRQTKAKSTKAGRTKTEQAKSKPTRAKQTKAKPVTKANQSKARQSKSVQPRQKQQSKQRKENDSLDFLLADLRENLSRELIGIFAILVGGFLLITLFDRANVPWLKYATGWVAPWVAIAVILIGLVLILGRRAGYWSVESVVGTQLLLLSLMIGTFAMNNPTVDWIQSNDGSDGGRVGWTLGSILVAALGQWPAVAVTTLGGLVGAWYLIRYTPLLYFANYIFSFFPFIPRIGRWISYQFARVLHLIKAEIMRAQPQGTNVRDADMQPIEQPMSSSSIAPQERAKAHRPRRPRASDNAPAKAPVAEPVDAPIKSPTKAVPKTPTKTPTKTKSSVEAPKQKKSRPVGNRPRPKPKGGSGKKYKPLRKPDLLPSIDILGDNDGVSGLTDEVGNALEERIRQTLEDFDVPVEIVHRESGPTVTQFGVQPLYIERAGRLRKIRVSRIVNLADDLALALEAPSIRIEAPVPGKPYVGIEVPNSTKSIVGIRGILASPKLGKDGGELPLALGRDTAGLPVVLNLASAPHMLIAGATGSGKSVCINTIINSLLMLHGPESLQFLMVDPKMVELPGYNGIPHLVGKVITETDQVMGMLTWLLLQMDDRYRTFQTMGVRNISSYNANVRKLRGKDAPKPLPYIVLVVDELADLMMTAADDIERQLCRLAQMARATGIHLILATQRPSADVVTGLIKANFPTRIAFAVTSQIDSRVIMDTPGAERLLGKGDMLLMRADSSKLERVQGCYVDDSEINGIVSFWKERKKLEASPNEKARPVVPPWNSLMDKMDDEDELIHEATDLLRNMETCSTSLVQRKLKIGYPKAARLMEDLESRGVVGPDMGGGQGRKVLLKNETDEADGDDNLVAAEENEILF